MKGEAWERMDAQPRREARELRRSDVPASPGVYAWYRNGEAIYAGRALEAKGLQDRVGKNHMGTTNDLSRSSFRRNVCEFLGIAPPSVTTMRPAHLSASDVEPVNEWIRGCEIAWIECGNADEAERLEKVLFAEWMPPLSKR